MRKAIVAGNWKMHKTASEAVELVAALKPLLEGVAVEVAVCPPFTSLQALSAILEGSAIGLGAQNMHWENEGAHTGEISAGMLLEAGCTYVILGHSERRQAGEIDELVHRKLVAALEAGLRPIVCVGETLAEREAGRIEEVVLGQVGGALGALEGEAVAAMVLAYEPVWAIGTGATATAAQAEEVHALIRGYVADRLGEETAAMLRIQYGGSVKPENAAELFGQDNIDGGLIGGAALAAEGFAAIVKAAL
ncbi:MAG: triose-phosphate isomerase [Candidatus Latescibacterota bacterium]|nr:triose-phosphate isomerase [Candidatus Latescibacterota bacterium]